MTCEAFPALYPAEQPLLPALAEAGVDAVPVVWTEPNAAYDGFDLILFRSIWDYFEKMDAFRRWLDGVAARGIVTMNPVELVRWNQHKSYLADLERAGARVVPTRHIHGDAPVRLSALLDDMECSRAVIKPAVSGAAFRTYLVDRETCGDLDAEASALANDPGLLVQPYLPQIEKDGEWSLLFFDGAFNHAVVKRPIANEFRVQTQFGGTFEAVTPPENVLRAAALAIASAPVAPAYARVDGVILEDGELYLMELELIEPYLYFEASPNGMTRYVEAIRRRALDAMPG